MKNIKTFCPLFPGFYNTFLELDESEYLRESNLRYEDIEIDYRAYNLDVCKSFCYSIESELSEYVKNVKFMKGRSTMVNLAP